MADVNPITYAGVGTGIECLSLPLIALRDLHVIGWSWWWVMAPAWTPTALVVLILAVGAATAIWRMIRDVAHA